MTDRQQHWDTVYQCKDHTRVSWFEEDCSHTVREFERFKLSFNSIILDVGAGASKLVDALLDAGYQSIYALDIAQGGLNIAKQRLGSHADNVEWICGDITRATLPSNIDLWHDRAAFHFLTQPRDQQAYVVQVKKYLRPGGIVMLSTFALNGPEKCSDLIIEQYDSEKLLSVFGANFKLLDSRLALHKTPNGGEQWFQHSVLQYLKDTA